jgi:oxygen-dependent protoporphyrinogen oxidase
VKNIGEENIRLNCNGLSFSRKENKYYSYQSNDEFSHVISTVGGYALEELFPFLEKKKLGAIKKMHYSKVVQVSLGFKKWDGVPLKAFGGLVPSVEQRRILGVLFLSSFLKRRAPKEGALLSVFLGGVRKPEMIELPDEEIIQIVKEELVEMMRLEAFEPDLVKIFRYRHAIPQYGFESEEKIEAIARLEEEHRGLILAGNIRNGIGIADRINQGRTVAEEIIKLKHEQ